MTYGLSPRLFIENGPANQAARALQTRSARALAAVLKTRPAANDDLCDGFPVAL